MSSDIVQLVKFYEIELVMSIEVCNEKSESAFFLFTLRHTS